MYTNMDKAFNLKKSTAVACPTRLLGKRCRAVHGDCICIELRQEPGLFDHPEIFMDGRKAVLFRTHNYPLGGEQFKTLQVFCDKHGFVSLVAGDSDWYKGCFRIDIVTKEFSERRK